MIAGKWNPQTENATFEVTLLGIIDSRESLKSVTYELFGELSVVNRTTQLPPPDPAEMALVLRMLKSGAITIRRISCRTLGWLAVTSTQGSLTSDALKKSLMYMRPQEETVLGWYGSFSVFKQWGHQRRRWWITKECFPGKYSWLPVNHQ